MSIPSQSRLPSLDALRSAARSVARDAGYELVVVFGSYARGEAGARDVDLGVAASRAGVGIDVLDATNRFIRALATDAVDIADLQRANPVLLMAAATDGVPLFEAKPGAFANFSSLAMRRYADTKKFRDAVRDDLREFAGLPPKRVAEP